VNNKVKFYTSLSILALKLITISLGSFLCVASSPFASAHTQWTDARGGRLCSLARDLPPATWNGSVENCDRGGVRQNEQGAGERREDPCSCG
jgi:hypothetical protein